MRATHLEPSLWTVADDASPEDVAATVRAALAVLRPRLRSLSVDLVSDGPWPDDAAWALEAVQPLRRRPRSITADLDPAIDKHVAIAAALAPFSIGCTGLGDRGSIWDVDDTGTSVTLALTEDEVARVRGLVAQARADDVLVPLAPRRRPSWHRRRMT